MELAIATATNISVLELNQEVLSVLQTVLVVALLHLVVLLIALASELHHNNLALWQDRIRDQVMHRQSSILEETALEILSLPSTLDLVAFQKI